MSKLKAPKNLTQKAEFLESMNSIVIQYCEKMQIDFQPSESNISFSPLYAEGREGPSEDALNKARENLRQYARVQKKEGPDGNHHKLGQFIRKKANFLFDAAEALENINPDYMQGLKKTADFRYNMKALEPQEIASSIEKYIFSQDIKNIIPMPERKPT